MSNRASLPFSQAGGRCERVESSTLGRGGNEKALRGVVIKKRGHVVLSERNIMSRFVLLRNQVYMRIKRGMNGSIGNFLSGSKLVHADSSVFS